MIVLGKRFHNAYPAGCILSRLKMNIILKLTARRTLSRCVYALITSTMGTDSEWSILFNVAYKSSAMRISAIKNLRVSNQSRSSAFPLAIAVSCNKIRI